MSTPSVVETALLRKVSPDLNAMLEDAAPWPFIFRYVAPLEGGGMAITYSPPRTIGGTHHPEQWAYLVDKDGTLSQEKCAGTLNSLLEIIPASSLVMLDLKCPYEGEDAPLLTIPPDVPGQLTFEDLEDDIEDFEEDNY